MRRLGLGRSGLAVSEIGLGLAAIGRPGYINLGRDRDLGSDRSVDAMRERAHRLLDTAYARGICYFDAARSYGLAEDFLASWLNARAFAPGEVTVGSKWGYRYTADWQVGAAVNEVKDHSPDNLRRQIAESRALLGERLSLYQIHSATLESGVLDDRGVIAELSRLRAGGLVVGLSVSGPRQADTLGRALEIEVDGKPLFDSVQATWNLLEPSAGPALAEAKQHGLGVIVKEALANGRLSPSSPEPPAPPLDSIARRLGLGLDAIAIAAALAQPWSDMVLSGAVTEEQLMSNLTATDVVLSLDELAGLGAAAEPPASYWSKRAELAWS
jgi:aryl-alcohol dehydrogenase-like predicted oxidoreductase